MKKIFVAVSAMLMLAATGLFAQTPPAKAAEETKVIAPALPSYMMIGVYMGVDYFFKAQNSGESLGMLLKAPINNSWGVQLDLGNYVIPITKHSTTVGATTTSWNGVGHEEYTHFSLNGLYYFEFHRYLQLKAGIDYYRFVRGDIINQGATATGGCGVQETICYKCMTNLFGFNVGLNIDVPIYRQVYAMGNVTLRYLLNHEYEKLPILEMRLGAGYKM